MFRHCPVSYIGQVAFFLQPNNLFTSFLFNQPLQSTPPEDREPLSRFWLSLVNLELLAASKLLVLGLPLSGTVQ